MNLNQSTNNAALLVNRLESLPVLVVDSSYEPEDFSIVTVEAALDFAGYFIASGQFLIEEHFKPDEDLDLPIDPTAVYLTLGFDQAIEKRLGTDKDKVFSAVSDVISDPVGIDMSGTAFEAIPLELLDAFNESELGSIFHGPYLSRCEYLAAYRNINRQNAPRELAELFEIIHELFVAIQRH